LLPENSSHRKPSVAAASTRSRAARWGQRRGRETIAEHGAFLARRGTNPVEAAGLETHIARRACRLSAAEPPPCSPAIRSLRRSGALDGSRNRAIGPPGSGGNRPPPAADQLGKMGRSALTICRPPKCCFSSGRASGREHDHDNALCRAAQGANLSCKPPLPCVQVCRVTQNSRPWPGGYQTCI
jgi:hypothetical protein